MKQFIIHIYIEIICIIGCNCYSQGLHTSSNKAIKAYNEGVTAYEYINFSKAEKNFKEAISIDKKFYEAYIMLGDLMVKQKRYAEASLSYKTAVDIDSLFFKPVFFTLANAEMMSGEYSNALIHYNVYLAQEGMSAKNRIVAAKNVKNCEFAINAVKNPVLFNPESVGSGINTTDDEYWPSITADGQTMIFTRQSSTGDNQIISWTRSGGFLYKLFLG